jgi:ppGpp synthetase/RelA/SpoT-type nucleotidyltranferase
VGLHPAAEADGYRSHHLSLEFKPAKKEDEAYAGRRIELQVRTRLQHSWATAIEAVSLYRNQDLKHHKGDADWLRLFALPMSSDGRFRKAFPTGRSASGS